MKKHSPGLEILLVGLLVLAAAAFLGIPMVARWKRSRDIRHVYAEVIRKLYGPGLTDEGYWVGDVAELYRMGQISREVAEADTAPLNPLVPSPIPFHGYYVRALKSNPAAPSDPDEAVLLPGQKRSRDGFAICIYPETPGPDKYAWIMCHGAELRLLGGEPPPGFVFPGMRELRKTWAIVD